jgi:hypothetical protein
VSALEKFLLPDEEIRFEAHARGRPPLTLGAALLYAFILGVSGLAELGGGTIDLAIGWTGSGTKVALPILLPAAAIVALIEIYRLAEFRSRIYAITGDRFLVLSGIHRTKLRREVWSGALAGVQVVGGVPEVYDRRFRYTLDGLDAVDGESIAHALDVPLHEPQSVGRLRRWRKRIALVLALSFMAVTETEALIQRQQRAAARSTWARATAAFAAVGKATEDAVAATMKHSMKGGGSGSGSSSGPFSLSADEDLSWEILDTDAEPERRERLDVSIKCSWTAGILPRRPTIVISERKHESANARFFEELRKAFDELGIEATWPNSVHR